MPDIQHRMEALFTAHKPWYGRTIPTQTKGKRTCAQLGCPTVLSRYNNGSLCFLHDPEGPIGAGGICEWCEEPFSSAVKGGSPKRFCSDLCRQRSCGARARARRQAS